MKGNVPDKVMRDIFRHGKVGAGSACAGEGTVAAYFEGTLTAAERLSFEQHASVCLDCQELIGLTIKMSEEAAGREAEGADMAPSQRTVLFRLSIPVVGLAIAGFFVVAGVVVFRNAFKADRGAPALQVADARISSRDARKPPESSGQVSPASPDAGRSLAEKVRRTDETPLPSASVMPRQRAKALPAAAPAEVRVQAKQVSAEADAAVVAQNQAAVRPQAAPVPAVNEPTEERGARQGAAPAAVGVVGGISGAPSRAESRFDEVKLGRETSPRAAGEVQHLRTALSVTPGQEKGKLSIPPPDPREVLLNFAAEAVKKDEAATQAIGDRVFHSRGSYWIDQNCVDLQSAEIVRIERDSSEFQVVIGRYPDLRRLLESGRSVLLSWEGKIYLIR